jgi:hypothetical protein
MSIIVPILVLKQVDGAHLAIWLVPLVALLYVADNQMHGVIPKATEHEKLFPSEAFLVENYVGDGMSDNILEQHAQLKGAWDRYLVDRWSGNEGTVEAGSYAFTVERAKAIVRARAAQVVPVQHKDPLVLAYGILAWNFLFAVLLFQQQRRQARPHLP